MTADTQPPSGGEWEFVASEWNRNRRRLFEGFRAVSEWLVDTVAPVEGETVLELAAGPGETGFLAASRIGPTGRLLSTDLAPTMVAAAEDGARALGLTNVECRVMDAQSIDLPDASVDAVISRLGLMLVPDPRAALGQVRRVLRPGGRLAYAVMGPPDRNQWMSLMMGALMQIGRQPVSGDPFALGGVFGLSTPGANEELLAEAGFTDITCGMVDGAVRADDVDDLWDLQARIAGPVSVTVEAMSPEEVAQARGALADMVQSFAAADGSLSLPSGLVTASAVAPARP